MTITTSINFQKIAELLKTLKAPIKSQEDIHLEFILKVDGRTVITQYFNSSSFRNISMGKSARLLHIFEHTFLDRMVRSLFIHTSKH